MVYFVLKPCTIFQLDNRIAGSLLSLAMKGMHWNKPIKMKNRRWNQMVFLEQDDETGSSSSTG
jgi:hypothetical protein